MTELTTRHRCDTRLVSSLYNTYADDLRRYLYYSLHNMEDAEDLLQDLFIKVMGIDLITEASARSLLFIMAKRLVIDWQRHRAFVRQQEASLPTNWIYMDEDSVARRVEAADLLSFERHCLSRLPAKRARVYQMYRHEELTADEIAIRLHLSKRTVECQIYLSTKDIKSRMKHII